MDDAKRKLVFEAVGSENKLEKKKRAKIRFSPDHNTTAYVKPLKVVNADYDSFIGLVLDESRDGCKIAFLRSVKFHVNEEFHVSIGKLSTLKAVVRWRKNVSSSLSEIGFEYIE